MRWKIQYLLLASALILIGPLRAEVPAWWSARGATNGSLPNNYAAFNQGQLKHFTSKAVDELNARLPGGAGTDLNTVVSGWANEYQQGGYSATNRLPSDFHAINAGQLKWIAGKINDRLIYARYIDSSPAWLSISSGDKELVNIGQLKTVFNFDLSAPAGQLPAWWQRFYLDQVGANPLADSEHTGMTLLDCFQTGVSPLDSLVAPVIPVQEIAYYLPRTVSLAPLPWKKIHYTLDGTDPSVSLTRVEVTGSISLPFSVSTTIKAVAWRYADGSSGVSTKQIVVGENEQQFNALNRRPRYLLREGL